MEPVVDNTRSLVVSREICFFTHTYTADSEENYFVSMPSKTIGSTVEKDLGSIVVLGCRLFTSRFFTDESEHYSRY